MSKRIVISCGPIPARLDSVKFLTNRFKGGLAFETAKFLALHPEYEVTVIKWRHTPWPVDMNSAWKDFVYEVNVNDVIEYYSWFDQNAAKYDAFIMAAAVANLMPFEPYEGKFPSHKYKPGDKFDIKFEIAPRAIDVIKQRNPRACLIGYKLFDAATDEELIDIARHTLADAKANIIFANTPATAKSRKIAVMADNSAVPCDFNAHLELIKRAIDSEYFKTEVYKDLKVEDNSFHVAEAIVSMFEKTFNGFGTIAVPVLGGGLMTTSRGHKSGPVYVHHIDMNSRVITANGKATLNAPALWVIAHAVPDCIIVHRHEDDPNFQPEDEMPFGRQFDDYLFPGTLEEAQVLEKSVRLHPRRPLRLKLAHHGDIQILPILPVDWDRYYELFPEKYFGTPECLTEIMTKYNHGETLEIGCNTRCACKYAYDSNVKLENSIDWWAVQHGRYDFILARNCAAYLSDEQIRDILKSGKAFAANVFLTAPDMKITETEASVLTDNSVTHVLRLPTDEIMVHTFFARDKADWEAFGLTVTRYARNSALLTRGIDPADIIVNLEDEAHV